MTRTIVSISPNLGTGWYWQVIAECDGEKFVVARGLADSHREAVTSSAWASKEPAPEPHASVIG